MQEPTVYPQLMVFHAKHGDITYLLRSQAELHTVAALVVKQRVEEGWYSYTTDPSLVATELYNAIELLVEETGVEPNSGTSNIEGLRALAALTEREATLQLFATDEQSFATLSKRAQRQLTAHSNVYQRRLKALLAEFETLASFARASSLLLSHEQPERLTVSYRGRRSNLALWLLEQRKDYEYEGFDYVTPLTVEAREEPEVSTEVSEDAEANEGAAKSADSADSETRVVPAKPAGRQRTKKSTMPGTTASSKAAATSKETE